LSKDRAVALDYSKQASRNEGKNKSVDASNRLKFGNEIFISKDVKQFDLKDNQSHKSFSSSNRLEQKDSPDLEEDVDCSDTNVQEDEEILNESRDFQESKSKPAPYMSHWMKQKNGNNEVLKALGEGSSAYAIGKIIGKYPSLDLNIKNIDNQAPLHLAVKLDRSDVVEVFLKYGADPNVLNT
jgi:ankyrin repeat protein